jgi:hypothetical protein
VTDQFAAVEQDLARLMSPVIINNTAVSNNTVHETVSVVLAGASIPVTSTLTTASVVDTATASVAAQQTHTQELSEQTKHIVELPVVVSNTTMPGVAAAANQPQQHAEMTSIAAVASSDVSSAFTKSSAASVTTAPVIAAPVHSEQLTAIVLPQTTGSNNMTTALQSEEQSITVLTGTQEQHNSAQTAEQNLYTDQAKSQKESSAIAIQTGISAPMATSTTETRVLSDVQANTAHDFDVDTPNSPLSPILEQADTWQVPTAANLLLPRNKFDAVLKIATDAANSDWDSESEVNSPMSYRPNNVSDYGDAAVDSTTMIVEEVDEF